MEETKETTERSPAFQQLLDRCNVLFKENGEKSIPRVSTIAKGLTTLTGRVATLEEIKAVYQYFGDILKAKEEALHGPKTPRGEYRAKWHAVLSEQAEEMRCLRAEIRTLKGTVEWHLRETKVLSDMIIRVLDKLDPGALDKSAQEFHDNGQER